MDTNNNSSGGSVPAAIKAPVRLLVDSRPITLQLIEDGSKSGKVVMRGEFARCGIATENKRVYPDRLWEREIRRLGKAMEGRQLYGELDHPADGRTQLTRASHLLTNLEIKGNIVIGEAEVMDTARGRDLKAILQAGGRVGISSRGYGSVAENDKGESIVQDDYRLVTFDFVADPADQHAIPDVFYEGKEDSMGPDAQEREQDLAQKFAQELEAAKKESKETTEAALREEFAKDVVARLVEMRAKVVEEVRGELMADPAVAGAVTALEAVKSVLRPFVLPEDAKAVAEQKDAAIAELQNQLAEQSLRVKELEEENSQLTDVAKEAGYKYFVESQISGDPDAELIRRLLGSMTAYEDSTSLKSALEAIRTDLAEKREEGLRLSEHIQAEEQKDLERKDRERVRALKQEKSLREENEKLRMALEKALQANEAMNLQVYAESRLANHPKAARIRPLIESANPSSRAAVDSLVSQFRDAPQDTEQLEGVRARVRRLTQGGHGPTAIEEETSSRSRSDGGVYSQLGVDISELRQLSGMSDFREESPSRNRSR